MIRKLKLLRIYGYVIIFDKDNDVFKTFQLISKKMIFNIDIKSDI